MDEELEPPPEELLHALASSPRTATPVAAIVRFRVLRIVRNEPFVAEVAERVFRNAESSRSG
jgi:hypothetical protein